MKYFSSTVTGAFCLLAVLTSSVALAAERIISTDAAATELLVAMGLGDKIIAVDVTSQPPTSEVARIGYHRNLSAEGLLSLKPDLVVGSEHMGPPVVLSALAQAQISTLQLGSANSYAQIARNIQQLGEQVGADTGPMLQRLGHQMQAIESQPLQQDRMVFVLAMDPSKLRVAGNGSGGQAFIELLGAQNAAGHQNYQTMSDESLLALAPTTLLIASGDQAGFDALLQQHPLLKHTPAGKNQRILRVDANTLVAGLSLGAVTEAARVHESLLN